MRCSRSDFCPEKGRFVQQYAPHSTTDDNKENGVYLIADRYAFPTVYLDQKCFDPILYKYT